MRPFIALGTRRATASLLLGFLALGLPLCFSLEMEDGFELAQTILALMAGGFLFLLGTREDWQAVLRRHWFFYLLVLAVLGTGLYSYLELRQDVWFHFPTQPYLWLLTALLFLTPLGSLGPKRKFHAFLVLGGAVAALYAVLQALGWDLHGWSTRFGGRGFATLGNPVFLAGHLLLVFPLALQLAVSRGGPARWAWTLVAILLTAGLLASQTRTAWLGLPLELGVMAVLARRNNFLWKGFGAAILAFFLVILAVPSLKERGIGLLRSGGTEMEGRAFLWKAAVEQWKEKPLWGQGPGGYAAHFHRTQSLLVREEPLRPHWTALHAHNDYLEILAERGLVGGILIGFLALFLLVRKLEREDGEGPLLTAGRAEFAAAVGLGAHALFHSPLAVVPTACALALLFNPSWDRGPGETDPSRGFFTEPRVLLGGGLAAVCVLFLTVAYRDVRLHLGTDLHSKGLNREALGTLELSPVSDLFHYWEPRIPARKAEVLAALGRREEAARDWGSLQETYPFNADIPAALCMLHGKGKEWDRAVAQGQRALELSPSHPQALENMAMTAFLRGRREEAIDYLSRLSEAQMAWGMERDSVETLGKIAAIRRAPR